MIKKVLKTFSEVSHFFKIRKNEISLKGVLFAILFSRKKNLTEADVLFFCHDNSRTTKVGNLMFAPIIDPIIEIVNKKFKTITIAAPFSVLYGKNCYGNVVLFNRSLLFAYLYRVLKFKKNAVVNINADPVIKHWTKVLLKVKPQIVLGINPPIELCIAAKNKNIWVADVQHGIISFGNYYDARKREPINQNGWPNAILCWDKFSKDFVDSNLSKYVDSIIIGNPSFYNSSLKNQTVCYKFGSSNPTIIVTLQYGHLDIGTIDKIFKELGMQASLLNFILEHGSQFNWYLRLHPAILNNRKNEIYKKFETIFQGHKNVDWEECNSMHLHALLQKCNAHVTFNSASVRDASLFGIKSAVLDTDEIRVKSYFGDLFENNLVSIEEPENSSVFRDWILHTSNEKSETGIVTSYSEFNIDIILSKMSTNKFDE